VHYMAPEQINGKPRFQSDQYALATVVYEWLCGKRPFYGESSIQIAMQQLSADPPPFSQQNASIPAGVERVIFKALAKDPQQRFDSVLAFVHALEQASQSVDQERFHQARNQAPLGVRPSPPPAREFFSLTSPALPAVLAQPNRKNLAERPRPWKSLNPAGRAFRSVSWSPDGSRIASVPYVGKLYIWNAITGDQLASRDYIQSPVIWSPKGDQIICRDTTHLIAIDATTLEVIRTYAEDASPETAAACSPNGGYVAAAGWVSFNPPKVWHIATGKLISTYEGHEEEGVRCLAWSPNSRTIVSGGENRGVHVWDAATGRKLAFYRANNQSVYAVAWSPDGKQVASASSDDKVHLWEPTATERWSNHVVEKAILFYAGHSVRVGTLAWSPDGRSIASGGSDGTIHVWDARTGGAIFIYKGHSGDINALAWSPDGTRIASVSEDRTIQIWQAPQ
ncbi:MAG TPA: WD40 repeat domain-containing serine/threonine-protein kinase, partial [Ktedonobacteraceae bacterium]